LTSEDNKNIRTIAVCASQVPFFTGGAEAHVNSLIDQLRKRGYDVDLINIPFKWYPHDQLLKSIEIWEKIDLSESNGKKIDLVISTKFPSYYIQHHQKVLWLIHQYRQLYDLFDSPYSGFNRHKKEDMKLRDWLIEKDTKVLRSYKKIFTNSKNTASRLKKYNDISSIPLYHPPKLAGSYHCDEDQGYILSVGRLESLKRVGLLIEALRFCDKRIKCKIVGTGPEEQQLKHHVQKIGVSDRVEFLGYVPDKALVDLYSHCSLVFFAPRDEDYGYITLEAFLSKKPVITSFDSGGPLEFVENKKTGVILPSLDHEEVSSHIQELFFDEKKKIQYGSEGYKRVKGISWDDVVNSLIPGNMK
jgi:glycosyltransferase involved in cell wall biosynthesis